MTDISRRFEDFLKTANKKLIEKEILLPIKTASGIMIRDVLISSNGNLKTVVFRNHVYKDIYLNNVAITVANWLALRKPYILIDRIYQLDQEYGRWFVDTQFLINSYRSAVSKKDFDRADMLWARYEQARDKAKTAKEKVQRLLF